MDGEVMCEKCTQRTKVHLQYRRVTPFALDVNDSVKAVRRLRVNSE
jgi:hypothetical protein